MLGRYSISFQPRGSIRVAGHYQAILALTRRTEQLSKLIDYLVRPARVCGDDVLSGSVTCAYDLCLEYGQVALHRSVLVTRCPASINLALIQVSNRLPPIDYSPWIAARVSLLADRVPLTLDRFPLTVERVL
jgi:hypothetical protein